MLKPYTRKLDDAQMVKFDKLAKAQFGDSGAGIRFLIDEFLRKNNGNKHKVKITK